MTDAPSTLDGLRAIRDPAERALAAKAYLANGEEKLAEARRLRDEAIRILAKEHGKPKAAELAGVSLGLVKVVTRPT